MRENRMVRMAPDHLKKKKRDDGDDRQHQAQDKEAL